MCIAVGANACFLDHISFRHAVRGGFRKSGADAYNTFRYAGNLHKNPDQDFVNVQRTSRFKPRNVIFCLLLLLSLNWRVC